MPNAEGVIVVETERSELPEPQLSEAEVRAVLEKAVQIERRGATSVAELTEAGREAGISPAAIAAAVAEVLAARAAPPPVPLPAEADAPARRTRWLAAAGWAGAGAAAGFVFTTGLAPLAFGLLGIGIGFRAFDHRRDRNFRQYELETTAGWGSWAAGALWLNGADNAEVVSAFAVMWTLFSAGGAAIIATKRRPQLPAATPEPSAETSPTIRPPDPV